MDVSKRRADALAGIRERASLAMCSKVDDKQALQVAMSCAMREPEDLIGFLLPQHQAKRVWRHKDELALTPVEWNEMFGKDAPALREAAVVSLARSDDFKASLSMMSAALRCTVGEEDQRKAYARGWTQALVYIGMHLDDPDSALESSLGTIVRADARRLEDLRAQIDDDGIDTMMMAKLLLAVSESVV